MLNLAVTDEERKLIEDIQELRFGEIYEISLERKQMSAVMPLSEKQKQLLQALRQGRRIEKLTVHEGEPTAAEIKDKTKHGRDCLRKVRFL
jgi:hypothetical protein